MSPPFMAATMPVATLPGAGGVAMGATGEVGPVLPNVVQPETAIRAETSAKRILMPATGSLERDGLLERDAPGAAASGRMTSP